MDGGRWWIHDDLMLIITILSYPVRSSPIQPSLSRVARLTHSSFQSFHFFPPSFPFLSFGATRLFLGGEKVGIKRQLGGSGCNVGSSPDGATSGITEIPFCSWRLHRADRPRPNTTITTTTTTTTTRTQLNK
jgi:hypothetical protein